MWMYGQGARGMGYFRKVNEVLNALISLLGTRHKCLAVSSVGETTLKLTFQAVSYSLSYSQVGLLKIFSYISYTMLCYAATQFMVAY